MDNNIVIFGKNKNMCQKLIYMLSEKGIHSEMPVLTGKHLESDILLVVKKAKGKKIVLVFKNEELQNVTEIFHSHGIFDMFVCPWDTHFVKNDNFVFKSSFIRIDNSKPRLNYVEIEVSECCNLNCKGCSEFSNLVKGKKFCDFELFEKDLYRMKDLFWGIGKIRLMGGEPLMNPDFIQFVKTTRQIFPDSDIRLVSNGLLIPGLNKTVLAEIKQANCSFDISNYPPTQKIIDSIKAILNEADISYDISLPIKIFTKTLLPEPLKSPNESFNNCLFTHCHALGNGYLSACTHQFYVHRLNAVFDLKYPEDEVIDIYNTHYDGWKINEIFNKPRDFCRNCAKGMVPYKWENRPKGEAEANDWIIKNTFINLQVMPVIQKSIKLFAKQLRHFKQRPNSNRR